MPDYKKGKIYCIRSNETKEIYIGSTCSSLKQRFSVHKSDYKKKMRDDTHRTTSSFNILKYTDAYIELLELYSCDSKKDLLRREGEHIRNTPNCINPSIAGRTIKEWRTDNKERLREYDKEYRKNVSPEKLKQWRQNYYRNNIDAIKQKRAVLTACPDCGKEIRTISLKKHRASKNCNTNPPYNKKEADRLYREKNKERIRAHKNKKVPCPKCDKLITNAGLSRHIRNKHG